MFFLKSLLISIFLTEISIKFIAYFFVFQGNKQKIKKITAYFVTGVLKPKNGRDTGVTLQIPPVPSALCTSAFR